MVEFIEINGKSVGDIKLLALSTCGWCAKTKAFFNERGVAYSYVDVDLLTDAEADEVEEQWSRFNRRWSFPTIIVNESDAIIGFDLEALEGLAGA